MAHPTIIDQIIVWLSFIALMVGLLVGMAGGLERLRKFFSPTINVEQDVRQLYVNSDPLAPSDNLAAATEFIRRHQ